MMIKFDGRSLQGTALQIVQSMRSLAQMAAQATEDEYIATVAERMAVDVTGSTTEERASSLVDAMVERGIAERV